MDSPRSLELRASLYALLSRLFTYPLDAEVLTRVAGLSLDDDVLEAPTTPSAALAEMQSALAEAGDQSELVETLNREATRLFEGPGQPAAPPFGSFYLDGRQLMGPEALAVRRSYLAAGLLPDQAIHSPPDHLALELGFMAALARAGSREALAASRGFLVGHLLNWIPLWRADVLAARPHPFFEGLSIFVQAVLEADLALLAADEARSIDPVLAPK